MLGKPFFSLCQSLQEARSFEDVADLLSNQAPALIGAQDVSLYVMRGPSTFETIYGHGEIAVHLRDNLELVNRLAPGHPVMSRVDFSRPGELGFAVSDYISPEEFRDCEFNRALKGQHPTEDALFGRLATTGKRQTILVGCRETGTFRSANRQVFDVLLYTARAVLARIASSSLEQQVVQYLLTTAGDNRNGFFILRTTGEVLPLNHDAVRLAERWWNVDEPFRELGPRAVEALRGELEDAWLDPITSRFKKIRLDLGGGPMGVHATYNTKGEILLILPLKKQGAGGGDGAAVEDRSATVLTRRQREIMDWISEGKTSAEVAIILDISPRTVEKHLEAVFQRLGVENRIGAVRRYLDLRKGQPV